MTISNPVSIGTVNSVASSTTLVLTTTVASPAGATIILAVGWVTTATTITVTDSAGNTYTLGTLCSGTATQGQFVFSPASNPLPSGGTITVTFAAAVAVKGAVAATVAGLRNAPADTEAAGATGTSAAPTITSVTGTYPRELVVGFAVVNAGDADTYTPVAGWTAIGSALPVGMGLRFDRVLTTTTAGKVFNPTLGTSRTWVVNAKTFKGAEYPFNPANKLTYLEM